MFLRNVFCFLRDIFDSRVMLFALAKNDLKSKYADSFLGILWAFIQPLITILVLWAVFQMGFRAAPVSDVPFILWYIPAFLVWNFFTEALLATTYCLSEYSYLVRKVNFRVSIIPVVKIISSFYVHIGFILFIAIMYLIYRIQPSIYWIQVFYYLFCTIMLLLGLGWLCAAISPFVKDVTSIVNVFVQIGFWATPIFWSPDNMEPAFRTVLKLNPMYYICEGYRDCFIYHQWFWQRGRIGIYFWVVTVGIFILGTITFKRLRPYFADEI